MLVARVETAVTLSTLLVLTTPWMHLLKALRTLLVPVEVIMLLAMTHRYVVLLTETANAMFESRQSRVVGRLNGHEQRRLMVNTRRRAAEQDAGDGESGFPGDAGAGISRRGAIAERIPAARAGTTWRCAALPLQWRRRWRDDERERARAGRSSERADHSHSRTFINRRRMWVSQCIRRSLKPRRCAMSTSGWRPCKDFRCRCGPVSALRCWEPTAAARAHCCA